MKTITEHIISIDWDFFIWNGMESEIPKIINVNDTELNLFWLFDWGHSEGHSPALLDILWKTRQLSWNNLGLDIKDYFNIVESLGCTDPNVFIDKINNKFLTEYATLYHSNSHLYHYFLASNLRSVTENKIKITIFDAHCDLGYDVTKIRQQVRRSEIDCSSWLYHLLKNKIVNEVDIVYPNWRGLKEWEEESKLKHISPLLKKINIFTFDSWVNQEFENIIPIDIIGVCRSSSWTPPWLDEKYLNFIHQIPATNLICMDCKQNLNNNGYNSCIPRLWND